MRLLRRYDYRGALLLIMFFNGTFLSAQQGGNIFYNLTTANGLSSNRTTSVIQDRQGFYWIGTLDGLNRFDGTSCKVFQHIQEDTNSLSHNNCISLLEDDKGDIWIATLMGLNRYRKDGKFDRFFFHHPKENFERANWIWGMTKDSSGNIWITSCGLWQYNIYSGKWKQWLHDPDDIYSIPHGVVGNAVYDGRNNCLWMCGSKGFILFDITSEKFYHKKNNPTGILLLDKEAYTSPIVLDDKNDIWFFENFQNKIFRFSLAANTVEAAPIKFSRGVFNLNKDNKNRLWINFWNGPSYIYNPSDRSLDSAFLDNYHSQSAISNNAKNLFIDKVGNYWISTWKGVTIFNPEAQAVKYYLIKDIPDNPLKDGFAITTIAEQNDSILWLGTNVGLYQYNLNQRRLLNKPMPWLRNNYGYIRTLFFQNDSVLWIGGWTELLRFDIKRNKLIDAYIDVDLPQFIDADAWQNIWVGTWRNGLYKFSASGDLVQKFVKENPPSESIYSNHLVSLGKGQHKNMWLGYNGGDGFSAINFSGQQFRHFKIKTSNRDYFPSNAINCINEDEKGNLWLGTFGRGLIRFNKANESYKTIMQSDGLKGNFINSILADDSARLWISTSTGINILDTRNNDIIQTDIDLSFIDNDFLANGIVRKNGKFLFFAGTRIAEVDPNSYYSAAKRYEILLSSFKIFDKEKYFPIGSPEKGNIELAYRQNFFSLDYSLLKPNPNSLTQYAYQLQGFDKDWNYVRERRTAYYTNVPPGEYTFLVKATDENGKWVCFSKPLSIKIIPPIWQKGWFIAGLFMLVLTGAYSLYRYRIQQLKKIFSIRAKISQDLHDELGATLSSIHIYSSVAAKALNTDTGKTRDALRQINENTRQVMENMSDIVWAISVDHGNETTLDAKLKNYGYELLTPLNINCVYRIDREAESRLVNMEARKNILLIAKEAINNIAKYSGATEASVRLEISGKDLELEIADNGNGISFENNHSGYGIHSMKERTEAMHGVFQIRPGHNKGTIIHCRIPLTTISDN